MAEDTTTKLMGVANCAGGICDTSLMTTGVSAKKYCERTSRAD
jgi:hypothetical protein